MAQSQFTVKAKTPLAHAFVVALKQLQAEQMKQASRLIACRTDITTDIHRIRLGFRNAEGDLVRRLEGFKCEIKAMKAQYEELAQEKVAQDQSNSEMCVTKHGRQRRKNPRVRHQAQTPTADSNHNASKSTNGPSRSRLVPSTTRSLRSDRVRH